MIRGCSFTCDYLEYIKERRSIYTKSTRFIWTATTLTMAVEKKRKQKKRGARGISNDFSDARIEVKR